MTEPQQDDRSKAARLSLAFAADALLENSAPKIGVDGAAEDFVYSPAKIGVRDS